MMMIRKSQTCAGSASMLSSFLLRPTSINSDAHNVTPYLRTPAPMCLNTKSLYRNLYKSNPSVHHLNKGRLH